MIIIRSWLFVSIIGGLLLLTSACKSSGKADSAQENKNNVSSVETEESKSESTQRVSGIRFSCETVKNNGQEMPATNVQSTQRSESLTVIYWNPENDFFGEWTPEKRCQAVSERFQDISNRDKLAFITADVAKWLPDSKTNIVCSVKYKGARCEEEDLLFTLQPEDEPNEILNELIAFRRDASADKSLTRGNGEDAPSSFEKGKRVFYNLAEELKNINSETIIEDKPESKPAF